MRRWGSPGPHPNCRRWPSGWPQLSVPRQLLRLSPPPNSAGDVFHRSCSFLQVFEGVASIIPQTPGATSTGHLHLPPPPSPLPRGEGERFLPLWWERLGGRGEAAIFGADTNNGSRGRCVRRSGSGGFCRRGRRGRCGRLGGVRRRRRRLRQSRRECRCRRKCRRERHRRRRG
jgi:hypothetical protein